ncbi:MAG TPA: hypothetical protein VE861_13685, partial [Gemmatimonadaceae bacterium]|nr:hypothetical protein [Gemmatimonadaceae bacterium]
MPLPMMITPPQSPGWREPAARADVKTIGLLAVPCASILAPLVMNRDEPTFAAAVSPRMRVPGWIVSVACHAH